MQPLLGGLLPAPLGHKVRKGAQAKPWWLEES